MYTLYRCRRAGRMAAEELRSAVQDLHVPDTRREPAPRKRRVTLALRHSSSSEWSLPRWPSATTIRPRSPRPQGYCLCSCPPTCPMAALSTDPSKPTSGLSSHDRRICEHTTPGSRAGRVVDQREHHRRRRLSNDGGVEATVNGHAARLYEYPIDNDQTLRIVMWIEEAKTSVVVTSTTHGRQRDPGRVRGASDRRRRSRESNGCRIVLIFAAIERPTRTRHER